MYIVAKLLSPSENGGEEGEWETQITRVFKSGGVKNGTGTIEHPCMKTTMLIVYRYLIIVQVFNSTLTLELCFTSDFHSEQSDSRVPLKPPIYRKRLA